MLHPTARPKFGPAVSAPLIDYLVVFIRQSRAPCCDVFSIRSFRSKQKFAVMRTLVISRCRRGFSVIELAVVIGIAGLLLAMLIPAVQAARESARGSHCANNLRNIGVALANFHAVRRSFPAGSEALAGTEQAWSSRLLPFIECDILAAHIDYTQPWNAPGPNLTAANQNLSIYVCPSGLTTYSGKQDYGGIQGTSLLPLTAGVGPTQAFGCGILIVTSSQQPSPVTAAKITDGLSVTLIVGESVDRQDESASRWACGRNCFAQNDQWVNMDELGSLHSNHPGGAQGLFADGHVVLLTEQIAPTVLGALCTRNGGEVDSNSTCTN
jgi:prepilin-type processing-associated H-X9-DG protein